MTEPDVAPATLDIRNRVQFQRRGSMVLLVMNDHGIPLLEDDLSQIISFLDHQRNGIREEKYRREAEEERRIRMMEGRN